MRQVGRFRWSLYRAPSSRAPNDRAREGQQGSAGLGGGIVCSGGFSWRRRRRRNDRGLRGHERRGRVAAWEQISVISLTRDCTAAAPPPSPRAVAPRRRPPAGRHAGAAGPGRPRSHPPEPCGELRLRCSAAERAARRGAGPGTAARFWGHAAAGGAAGASGELVAAPPRPVALPRACPPFACPAALVGRRRRWRDGSSASSRSTRRVTRHWCDARCSARAGGVCVPLAGSRACACRLYPIEWVRRGGRGEGDSLGALCLGR